jgi:hypothetical protein
MSEPKRDGVTEAGRSGLEWLRALQEAERTQRRWSLLETLLLIGVFAAAVLMRWPIGEEAWPHNWNYLFELFGILCLGLGIGFLFGRRRVQSELACLRSDYSEMAQRTADVVAAMDRLAAVKHRIQS